jgi:hypothetical protein
MQRKANKDIIKRDDAMRHEKQKVGALRAMLRLLKISNGLYCGINFYRRSCFQSIRNCLQSIIHQPRLCLSRRNAGKYVRPPERLFKAHPTVSTAIRLAQGRRFPSV